jgi:hypothetical protein
MHESMSVLAWVPQRDTNMLQMILDHRRSASMPVFSADYYDACRVLHAYKIHLKWNPSCGRSSALQQACVYVTRRGKLFRRSKALSLHC